MRLKSQQCLEAKVDSTASLGEQDRKGFLGCRTVRTEASAFDKDYEKCAFLFFLDIIFLTTRSQMLDRQLILNIPLLTQ